MIHIKDLARIYFRIFSQKNVEALRELFAPNVTLHDWDIKVLGIEEVIQANKNIFDNVNTINVNVLNIADNSNTVFAQLEITINNSEIINVVDIIEFDTIFKIKKIMAYKQ